MWEPVLSLDSTATAPLFLQIAHAVSEAVRAGQLRPGERLPGSRTLAKRLGVHRNTVLTAYDELEAQGWVRTEEARGTFVSDAIPELTREAAVAAGDPRPLPTEAGFAMPPARDLWSPTFVEPGVLSLSGGLPDLRLVPVQELSRAYRRAARRPDRATMDYGDPRGWPPLREALARMLRARRGVKADAESVMVTRGSQMAIYLVGQALLRPGDVVAVEAFGYGPAWSALRLAGAQLVPIPVDGEGLRVDLLEARVARGEVRAVYVTPHHQYPTLAVLSAGRRLALLELARRHRIAIIEDDYDNEFHFEGRPVLPLASADRAGVVIYVGSLSKVLAPGPRVGYVVAPRAVIEVLAELRRCVDRQGDFAVEAAVAELIEDGELRRHIRRMHRIYASRREALAEALERELGDAVRLRLPAGGMALWVDVLGGHDTEAWAERARARHGVAFVPGGRFAFDQRPRPNLRLGFARLTEAELAEAARRMAAALKGSLQATPTQSG